MEVIAYPTMAEITHKKKDHTTLQKDYNGSGKNYCVTVIDNTASLVYNKKHHLIPKVLKRRIVACYHHYV